MSIFTRPNGDPGGIRAGADSLTRLAERAGVTRLDVLLTAGGEAEVALPTRRVADFQGLRQDGATALEEAAQVLVDVAGALADYADALETAQSQIDTANRGYDEASSLLRLARSTGEAELESQALTDLSRHRGNGNAAEETFSQAESRARSALAGLATTWSPEGASTSAVDAWAASTAAIIPQEVGLDREQVEAIVRGETSPQVLVDAGKKLSKGLVSGWYSWQAIAIARHTAAYNRVAAEILLSRGQGRRVRSPMMAKRRSIGLTGANSYYKSARRIHPDRTALRHAQTQFRRSQSTHFSYDEIRSGVPRKGSPQSGVRGLMARVGNSRVAMTARAGGRVLAPLGAITGGYDIYRAIRGGEGMSSTDRVVTGLGGAGGLAAGGLATYAMVVGVGLGPLGLGIVAVGGAVAAGAWLYNNREAVADAAKKAVDVGKKAFDGAKNVGKKVWKGIFG